MTEDELLDDDEYFEKLVRDAGMVVVTIPRHLMDIIKDRGIM